jgi:3',5'-cyclic AMP phosphodiesterase CpdA
MLSCTIPEIFPANRPIRITLQDLLPNTAYDYRIRVRKAGDITPYEYGDSGSFTTKKERNSTFNFSIMADSHMGFIKEKEDPGLRIGLQTIENASATDPDFFITMGDESMTHFESFDIQDSYDGMLRYAMVKRFYSRLASHSPIFYVLGNHDGELSWVMWYLSENSYQARRYFINNPSPETYIFGGGSRCNYYAWEWGDALFVCLDPFYNTGNVSPYSTKPYGSAWTLGSEQKAWLKKVLAASSSRWKFIFSHHILASWAYDGYGRGGAKYAHDYEQGEIHQMMLDHGAHIFFYGHDHVYADSTADGIHYTCCGRPGWRQEPTWTFPDNPCYPYFVDAYPYGWITDFGFVNVTVSPDEVTVAYLKTAMDRTNKAVLDRYTLTSPPMFRTKWTTLE